MVEVVCPYCGGDAEHVTGEVIYPHRRDLFHRKFYLCKACDAYVGCNLNGRPLGSLANAELRRARLAAHNAFDPLWKSGGVRRVEAYAWLSREVGVPKEKCHIGMFDLRECKKVLEVCHEERDRSIRSHQPR